MLTALVVSFHCFPLYGACPRNPDTICPDKPSGRSESAQAVFGVAPPESVTIEIDRRAVKISRPEDAIELGIAYASEDASAKTW